MFLNDPHLTIRVLNSISDIDQNDWDRLSGERPFQSYRWYQFGERVMDDCEPVYLLAYQDEQLVGRAALWVIRNEPIPKYAGRWRGILQAILRRWPLLVCRSPISFTTGLILPEENPLRDETLVALVRAALTQGRQRKCSALLFDYLGRREKNGWTHEFAVTEVSNPGTIMQNRWQDFESYQRDGNKKGRQHYKRTVREAEKLNIKIARHTCVKNVDAALHLIRSVEQEHGAPENPWARGTLENMEMAGGVFLEAVIDEELVGCGVLFEDNSSQMASLLGLAPGVQYVYFMLVYENLKDAFERNVRLLRWGSGAYQVKQQLGFSMEDNSVFVYTFVHPLLQKGMRWFI